MKQIILALIVATMALSFSMNAQQPNKVSKSETEFEILKDQYQKLLNQQVELEKERGKMIDELKSEREKYLNFMELIIGICSGILVLLGAIATFTGWKTRSDIKKQLADIERKTTETIRKESERLETDAKEKLQSHTNQLILDVSRLINRNPDSIKEMIDRRINDYEAKQNNPICLYHTAGDGIDEQLKAYDFNIIESYEINHEEEPTQYISYKNASVVFIADTTGKFSNGLKDKVSADANYFYLGSGRFDGDVRLKNFANTPIAVEHNLLDLLRYIEFKKSDIKR